MTIKNIIAWFNEAKPNPTKKDINVQLGCHYEEIAEMMQALMDIDKGVAGLADDYKSNTRSIEILSRKKLLDALCDQVVTAIGLATMLGYDFENALAEVNRSNWSKFENGKAIFDNNGKIIKGKDYKEPELTAYLNKFN
ncbi:Phosphoribosyl-ATP pyrophosphohydrolase [Moraxella macacae 0408225]|uniref:Phosphoribosyl-ATP pyrophosphohydrolase n=1 Tax=Moraxella macacae 0408225 TaxID=1230338 RepID=L2F749_9GAMM|nr:nucleoside triphosphate pyrophosphohydrolase family protein [Moraxella macacae]ELA08283.1 Phosphoribosyl-ATP pyrophosphohydrolase [Moraxella macacae 0408225]